MRAFTAAAVQLAPTPGPLTERSVQTNIGKAATWTRRCVESTGADLVVLPETCTTGFNPGMSAPDLWELVSEIPGPISEPFQDTARDLGAHLCYGTYERGPDPGTVYNSAVLIGPDGAVLGVYRKTHPFRVEDSRNGGWTTAGSEVCVADTALGRIGMAICFDGDFPELWRSLAVFSAGASAAGTTPR